jgi:hypothetical protein
MNTLEILRAVRKRMLEIRLNPQDVDEYIVRIEMVLAKYADPIMAADCLAYGFVTHVNRESFSREQFESFIFGIDPINYWHRLCKPDEPYLDPLSEEELNEATHEERMDFEMERADFVSRTIVEAMNDHEFLKKRDAYIPLLGVKWRESQKPQTLGQSAGPRPHLIFTPQGGSSIYHRRLRRR